LSFLSFVCN